MSLHVCTGNILRLNLTQNPSRRNNTAVAFIVANGVAVARLMDARIYICICYHGKCYSRKVSDIGKKVQKAEHDHYSLCMSEVEHKCKKKG